MKKVFTSMLLAAATMLSMQANVWVLGTVGDQEWDPSVGTMMDSVAPGTYELQVPIYSGKYFSFTTALATTSSGWDDIAPYRFGAPANDYEITEELLGEPIQCGEYGASKDNAFKTVFAGMYKITLDLPTRIVMFEKVGDIEEKPDSLRVDGNIYILGDVNNNGWVTNNGVKMTAGENNTFTANVTITAEENGYFGFTKGLSTEKADNWDMIAPYRFAAVDEASQGIELDVATPLSEDGNGNFSFFLPAGNYVFNLDMEARTLTVTKDEANHIYIVGNNPFGNWDPASPMSMNEVTEGIFEAKATFEGDVWFIFSGARGSWDDVNALRYGPVDDATEDQVVAVGEEVTTQLTTSGKSYKITGDGSEYTITFDLNNLKFKFEAAQAGVPGDSNGDGIVDIADVNAVINMMLGKTDADTNCDMNGDGIIDIADVNMVINTMLGK